MAAPEPTNAALLGDRTEPQETFSVFYRRHVNGILALCAHQGLQPQDAADVTSDVFMAALKHRYTFDPAAGEAARPWLFGIAKNVLSGHRRRSRRESSAFNQLRQDRIVPTGRDLADYAELQADVDRALRAIQQLPLEQQSAVVARHVEDASYVDLAERLGVSEDLARQRVSRGLKTVRSRLLWPLQ